MIIDEFIVLEYLAQVFRSNTSDIGRHLNGSFHKKATTTARRLCHRLQKKGLATNEDWRVDGVRYVIWSLTAKGYKIQRLPVPDRLAAPTF